MPGSYQEYEARSKELKEAQTIANDLNSLLADHCATIDETDTEKISLSSFRDREVSFFQDLIPTLTSYAEEYVWLWEGDKEMLQNLSAKIQKYLEKVEKATSMEELLRCSINTLGSLRVDIRSILDRGIAQSKIRVDMAHSSAMDIW